MVFAGTNSRNASFKDLGAVCTAIRYKDVNSALQILDSVINKNMPILYRRHNKHVGARHELQGKKGRYPKKCAKIVNSVLQNASSMAESKGYDPTNMFVVHASANKTQIVPRQPSKGILFHSGFGGYASARRSNIELAKVEIGIANIDDIKLGSGAMKILKRNAAIQQKIQQSQKQKPTKQKPKQPQKPVQDKQKEQPQEKNDTEAKQQNTSKPKQPSTPPPKQHESTQANKKPIFYGSQEAQ